MSHIRPDDLEMGIMFQVSALGTVSLGQTSNVDLAALQKHLRDLYLAYHKPSGPPQPLPQCCLVVSNRGLAVTESGSAGHLPTAETLYNIPSVSFAAAVKFVLTGKKEKDFKCAFDAIDSESPATPKGKNDLYVGLDKRSRHLAKVTSHSAICACVIQRMTGVKASELHAFVCQSDDQARDVIAGLTTAARNYSQKETYGSIYGQSPYEMSRPSPAPNGGLDNIQRPPYEAAHGFHGYPDPGPQMGYRGPEVMQPGATRPEMNDNSTGWNQDLKSQRPIQDSEGPQGVGGRRDQLLRNFQEDQRRNEQLRSASEQGIYDMQQQPRGIYDMQQQKGIHDMQQQKGIYDVQQQPRGIYDMQQQKGIYDMQQQPRGIYDMQQQKGIYDMQQQKGIYDMQQQKGIYDMQQQKSSIYDAQQVRGVPESQPSIYEYRPQQPQAEPSRNLAPSQAPEGIYGGQPRGSYDSPMAMKKSLGSTEKLYEETTKSPDGSKNFAIPRFKVNYEPPSHVTTDYETSATGRQQGGHLGYEAGNRSPRPSSPYLSSKNEKQFAPDPTLERKGKKVQPPAPAKTRQPSATSPTTEATPRGGPLSGTHAPEPQSAPEKIVAPRKVAGIKVFPTIMLRGAQAHAAATAAGDDDDDDRRCNSTESSKVFDNLRTMDRQQVGQRKSPLDQSQEQVAEKSKKEREIEAAMGGMAIEHGRDSRSSQDFEHSLGYFP